jgi:hypothetical protein
MMAAPLYKLTAFVLGITMLAPAVLTRHALAYGACCFTQNFAHDSTPGCCAQAIAAATSSGCQAKCTANFDSAVECQFDSADVCLRCCASSPAPAVPPSPDNRIVKPFAETGVPLASQLDNVVSILGARALVPHWALADDGPSRQAFFCRFTV